MKITVYIILILSLVACNSTKLASDSAVEDQTFENIINTMSFQIQSDWAQPQITTAYAQLSNTNLVPFGSTIGNININGTSNYLEVKDSLAKGFLPFYGERFMAGSIGSNQTGIEFEGVPHNLRTKRGKKDSYEIRFSINDKNTPSENYMVYVQIFSNSSSSILLNSSHRSGIRFRGKANTINNNEK